MAIETLEHGRNIKQIFEYMALRLRPDGKAFVQSLVHQLRPLVMNDNDWMGHVHICFL